ncbi:FKBP-type peptidyl-prolyl cis-trans isomerase [Embleya sp. NPDC127516]|uniref:protein kinase domain-containing protein n=1 Tax=Embleya sp. NPDC127516 TaxID=3363990 RepID=UPI003809A313
MSELTADDPSRIGPFRIERRLGQGGMGRVYLGRSPSGRAVAIKVVRPELADDADFRRRFAREVAAARAVGGAFTAAVVDAAPDAPSPWLATVYVDGMSLSEAVAAHGPWPSAESRMLGAGLAEALAAIHGVGVIHRDLKPSNVMLAPAGPVVIDFGISLASEASALTHTGSTVGSPGFMSPEQCGGLAIGPASDVFSLGAVLVFAARGEGPFGTGPTPALLYRVVHNPPALDGVPPALLPLLSACLAKSPEDRPTAAEVLTELAVTTVPGSGRRRWLPDGVAEAIAGRAETGDGVDAGAAASPAATPDAEGVAHTAHPPHPPHASAPVGPPADDQPLPPIPPPPVTAPPTPFAPPPTTSGTRRRPRRVLTAAVAAIVVTAAVVAALLATREDGRDHRNATGTGAVSPKPVVTTPGIGAPPSGGTAPTSPSATSTGDDTSRGAPDMRRLTLGPADKMDVRVLALGSGAEVKAGQRVEVRYTGFYYADGVVFDSTWTSGSTSSFAIGVGQLIQGWDEGLVGQRVGSRVQLVIPPGKAYGAAPPGDIRPNATLVFVVDLLAAT